MRLGVRGLLVGLLLTTVWGGSPAGAVSPLNEVLRSVGFDDADIAKVRAGGLVKGLMKSTSERELAIKIAFLIKTPPSQIHDLFVSQRDYHYDPSVTAFAPVEGEGSLRDFNRLHLDPKPDAMAKAYVNAKPGSALNLSREEIAAFNALKQGEGSLRERVEAQGRKTLLARYQAYRLKGLAGIAPYARRGGKDFFPGKGLRRKTESEEVLKRDAPAFHAALLEYPKFRPEGLSERFYWVNFRVDDKPTIALVHRMDDLEGDVYVFAERHFYVSRSHNTVQTVGGAFPVDEGTVVLYVNRTSTDQVGGFGSATKRALGKRVMAGQLAETFDRIRAAEEKR
ncbi:MAG: hypothetical protein QNK04_22420 [Myxococcota bacterium]|nr:hypothetical protein [Myxococcota bacterium]